MKTPAIDKAIAAVGSLTKLAARMKVDPQVLVNWRKRGIPAERVLEVERATVMLEGELPKVGRHELRPDLYPEEARAA